MGISNGGVVLSTALDNPSYNRAEELKAFDATKVGVKGLVDSGLLKIPKMFVAPSSIVNHKAESATATNFKIPVIDLQGEHNDVVLHIKDAAQKWGFFQIVNHGIPIDICDEMLKGNARFNEEDDEVKKNYHSRDPNRKVKFFSNFDLYKTKAANWRDTLSVDIVRSEALDPTELPPTCREIIMEYTEHVFTLGDKLFELLSEAIGLQADHLKQMNASESFIMACHYYPACPEPELTYGLGGHTDVAFLTILLQDEAGGLQVFHQDHWIDVTPIPGALVINIGDLLQITSNDKLKSVEHRVLANQDVRRVSVPCFLSTRFDVHTKPFGPIKELISDDSAPIYRELTYKEYLGHFIDQGLDGKRNLDCFKL